MERVKSGSVLSEKMKENKNESYDRILKRRKCKSEEEEESRETII